MNYNKKITTTAFFIIAFIASSFSCKTVGRTYMNNLESSYPTVRTFFEVTPPAVYIKMKDIQNLSIPGPAGDIQIRLYIPENTKKDSPVLFYIHGGGFVAGNINHVDRYVRLLAQETKMPAISVDYRLAPENPWPAALEDCIATYLWAEENAPRIFGGKNRELIVIGESAGANLATSITHWRREAGLTQPLAQILYSPYVGNPESENGVLWPSRQSNAKVSVITPQSIDFFNNAYTGNQKTLYNEPYIYPVLHKSFSNLPPAFITICEYDTLRDEGTAYAALLKRDGVTVKKMYLLGKDHAWIGPPVIKKTAEFIEKL
ncbi:MAG TPA: alpha/beta hydrolase [Treponemataceae bacterium]|nr:alpha/beta hydrolase [Treponemataceae bacterium]